MSDSVETEIKDLSKLLQDGRKRKATLKELIARDDAAAAQAIARWISIEGRASLSKAEKLMREAAEALSRMPKSGTAALLGMLNLEGSEHVRHALVALGDSEQVRAAARSDMARWAERHAAVSPVLAPLDERLRVLARAHLYGKSSLYSATRSDSGALDALVPALGERVQGDRNSKDFASYATGLRALWHGSDRFWPLVQVLLAQSAVGADFAREVLDHPCARVSQLIDQIVTGLPAGEGKSLQDTLLARLSDPQLEIASACARALHKVAPQLYPAAVRDVLGRWPMDMQLGFLPSLLASGDQDAIYATIETELGGANWHSAVCALEAIDTPRAVEMLSATGMSRDLPDGGQRVASALAGIQIGVNWMKEPSALQALRTLLGAKSAKMRQHASDWLVRRERKEQGIADWYTVPKGATPSGEAAASNAPRA